MRVTDVTFDQLLEGQPFPLTSAGTAAAVAVGLVLVLGPLWRVARIAVTVAHELGHAAAARVVGAGVRGITLRWDTSGETQWTFVGNPGRLRRVWVAWWGYPAPPVAATVGVWALTYGFTLLWVLTLAAAALTTLLWARNALAALIAVAAAGTLAAAVLAGPTVTAAVAVATVTVLGVGGVRCLFEYTQQARAGGNALAGGFSDSQVIASLLPIPARLVRWTFTAAAAGCAVASLVPLFL